MLIPELGLEPESPEAQAAVPSVAPGQSLERCPFGLCGLVPLEAGLLLWAVRWPVGPSSPCTLRGQCRCPERLGTSTHSPPPVPSLFPVQMRSRPPTCPRHAVSCGSTLMGQNGLITASGFLSNYGPPQDSRGLCSPLPRPHLSHCCSSCVLCPQCLPTAHSSPWLSLCHLALPIPR